jgi:cupin 2 domain-containing protein
MIDHVKVTNIFGNIPENLPEELIEIIAESREVRIERIVSKGHSSPPGYWYYQTENEFILLIEGKAGLVFDGRKETIDSACQIGNSHDLGTRTKRINNFKLE